MGQQFLKSVDDPDLYAGETLAIFQSVGSVEVVSKRFMMQVSDGANSIGGS